MNINHFSRLTSLLRDQNMVTAFLLSLFDGLRGLRFFCRFSEQTSSYEDP